MIVLAVFLAGFALGWVRAGQRGGKTVDKIQYGVAHGAGLALAAVALAQLAALFGLRPF